MRISGFELRSATQQRAGRVLGVRCRYAVFYCIDLQSLQDPESGVTEERKLLECTNGKEENIMAGRFTR